MYHTFCFMIILLVCTAVHASAATYYVDYDGGDDKAKGTSVKSAWKHCPSDAQATNKSAACKLVAGDLIIFKGGVRYRGMINKAFSGSPDKPIIYDGNTEGKFGEGKAIVDGSLALSNWMQCKNADEAGGNPLYKEIWYTDIDYKGGWRGLNLLGAQVPMHVSQHPNPKDPLYQEAMGTYAKATMPIKRGKGKMYFSDPENLAGKPDDYFNGMGFCFHGGHNMACYLTVTDFDAQTQTITTTEFKDMVTKGKTYKNGTKYCFFNSVKIIDQAGEYAMQKLEEGRVRIFAWPQDVKSGQPQDISRSDKGIGFDFKGVNHVRVRGFKIERQGGKKGHGVLITDSKDIRIEGCEVSQVRGSAGIRGTNSEEVRVVDCYVHHLPGHTFGVFMRKCKDVEVVKTKIHKPTATGLDFYTVTGGKVSGCEVSGHTGMHANGITFYLGNRDLIIENNYVHSGNIPMTIKQSGNVIIRNNILDGNGSSMSIGMWGTMGHEKQYWKGPTLQDVTIVNNILVNGNPKQSWRGGIFSNMKDLPTNLVIKNNIVDGMSGKIKGDFSHNIYTRKVDKKFMGEACTVVTDLNKLFADMKNGDYRPAKGSPAIGAGIPLGLDLNKDGEKRSKDKAPSIGAY